jgi:RNase H-fold protein (predicted Holliday junction resolvase)
VNKLTLAPGCERRIGRADIEESKSGIALNAPPPQASYPCGNFSDTSSRKKETGTIWKLLATLDRALVVAFPFPCRKKETKQTRKSEAKGGQQHAEIIP